MDVQVLATLESKVLRATADGSNRLDKRFAARLAAFLEN